MTRSHSILIATAICACSLITSAVCYARITTGRESRGDVHQDIPLGDSLFSFKHDGRCFGYVALIADERTAAVSIKGAGHIRITFMKKTIPVEIELQAEFNALRQLGASFLKLSTSDSSLMLSTLNVRPIAVNARFQSPAGNRDFAATVPGPITIRKASPEMLRITGEVGKDLPQLGFVSSQPLLQRIAIAQEAKESMDERCSALDDGFELDPIVNLMSGFTSAFPIKVP